MQVHEMQEYFAMQVETLRLLSTQLEQVSQVLRSQVKLEKIDSLRDLLTLKVLIAELESEHPGLALRLSSRLDALLLSIGDDELLCEAIQKANALINSHKVKR